MINRARSRILVIDDEYFNQQLLLRILCRDFDVDTADNGQIALEMLHERPYDLVLLDMMMPVLNGRETLKAIRNEADLAELPVIIVSALSETREVVEGIALGANDYITKPLDTAVVNVRVRTQILLKQAMDERRESIARLESANKLKARMMQVASHDLRNPLNNLRLLLNILGSKLEDKPETQSLMGIAEQATDTMLEIIHDFLGNITVDNNGISVDMSDIEAETVFEHVLEQYRLSAQSKQIELEISLENAWIHADSRRLQQVFANLLSNAIKYSPKKSRVQLRSFIVDDCWRLEVQDSGQGIPEKEQQHLFTAFSKNLISTKPTNGESSTGLGLWIAAEMMRLQGGRIGMDSPKEGGCCFWLELPLVVQKAYAHAS